VWLGWMGSWKRDGRHYCEGAEEAVYTYALTISIHLHREVAFNSYLTILCSGGPFPDGLRSETLASHWPIYTGANGWL
jgi:hypothetical protein